MKFKKVVVILICAFVARFVAACITPCPETLYYTYTYLSLQADNLDNSGNETVLALDSVPRKAFGIRLAFLLEKIALNTNAAPTLFSSAYADECAPPYSITSHDTIVAFNIYTVTKFNAAHEAGSDVSDYFRLKWYDRYEPISQFVTYPNQSFYFNFSENKKEIDVFLLTPPQSKGLYSFKIEILLSDGRTLSSITDSVLLY